MVVTKNTYLYDEMLKASAEVDFDDRSDAIGYAMLIFAVANRLDIVFPAGNMQSREAIRTVRLANEWMHNIKARIPDMVAGDAMELLEPYDFMHMVGNHTSIPKALENQYIIKATEARIHGDKSVNQYHLYLKIRRKLRLKEITCFGRPLEWYLARLEHWHDKFKCGKANEALSDYDTLEIVGILMSEDLFAYEGGNQGELKNKLFDNHCHYLDEIDNLGFDELGALSRFVSSSTKFLSPEQYQNYEKAITQARINRPATNRFLRLYLQSNLVLLSE